MTARKKSHQNKRRRKAPARARAPRSTARFEAEPLPEVEPFNPGMDPIFKGRRKAKAEGPSLRQPLSEAQLAGFEKVVALRRRKGGT